MKLTPIQIISGLIAVLGAISTSTANLNDLFGPHEAKIIVSAASLLVTVLSAFMMIISGQVSQIRSVQAMPGVESITVNKNAGTTLATMAMDPKEPKIEMAPGAGAAVAQTAKDGQS